jgi:hypothetical protein
MGRQVNDRGVQVRRLQRGDALDGLHILFIGRVDAPQFGELLARAKGQPLLTVTSVDDALSAGSIINFVLVQDRVRFDVATGPAEHGNLRISSRLLGVARHVRTN